MKSFLKTASRAVAALFAVALVTMGVASPAFADGATGSIKNANSGKSYDNLIAAIKDADDGNTINLGTGNYTTYGADKNLAVGKSLTFVGSGTDSTTWALALNSPIPITLERNTTAIIHLTDPRPLRSRI